MQLYNLTANYQQILDYIDNSEELDESLLIDTLESILHNLGRLFLAFQ